MAVATDRPPYQAYAAILGTYVGGVGLAGIAARIFDRNPACQSPLGLVVLSFASFKAARTLARCAAAGLAMSQILAPRTGGSSRGRSPPPGSTTGCRPASPR
jgi:hypothetical protein